MVGPSAGRRRYTVDRNAMPYFTLIIPTFNRRELLERALRTCLTQSFTDWEAIVVDDASTDGSSVPDVIRRVGDARIRLVQHQQNLGVCAARNTGLRQAQGTWLIFHDDDDELVPGSLQHIRDAVERAGERVHRHVFAYRTEDGRLSPAPPLQDGTIWEYRQYIEWLDAVTEQTDFLNCLRRDVFQTIAWPTDRSREEVFHLALARRFRTQCHSTVVAIIHDDAGNRFTAVPGQGRLLDMSPSLADQWIRLLDEHGEALAMWAPRTFERLVRSAAINSYMAGRRQNGFRYAFRLVRHRPLAVSGWAALVLGLVRRHAVAFLVAAEKRRRSARTRSRYTSSGLPST
jgi:glycosyltransferase involved in cell wall biosynthesis